MNFTDLLPLQDQHTRTKAAVDAQSALLREPRLLVPGMQPLGRVLPDRANSFGKSVSAAFVASNGFADILGRCPVTRGSQAITSTTGRGIGIGGSASSDTSGGITFGSASQWLATGADSTVAIIADPFPIASVSSQLIECRYAANSHYIYQSSADNYRFGISANYVTCSVMPSLFVFRSKADGGNYVTSLSIVTAFAVEHTVNSAFTIYYGCQYIDTSVAMSLKSCRGIVAFDNRYLTDTELVILANDPWQWARPT